MSEPVGRLHRATFQKVKELVEEEIREGRLTPNQARTLLGLPRLPLEMGA